MNKLKNAEVTATVYVRNCQDTGCQSSIHSKWRGKENQWWNGTIISQPGTKLL